MSPLAGNETDLRDAGQITQQSVLSHVAVVHLEVDHIALHPYLQCEGLLEVRNTMMPCNRHRHHTLCPLYVHHHLHIGRLHYDGTASVEGEGLGT